MGNRPRKRFGQHFLREPAVIQRILTAVLPGPADRLVEIGPGLGAITRELLRAAGRLDAVELDRDLIEPLGRSCAGIGRLVVHRADALTFDLCRLATPPERLRLVGNLPYNISTPLLFRFIAQMHCIRDMHLMLQKEVVERLAAEPGQKTYGRLSVMVQSRCEVERVLVVGPGAFTPAPKVSSAVVRVVPLRPPPVVIAEPQLHARIVAAAFSQRRKRITNSLRGLADAALMEQCGLDPGARAEQLSVADFAHLANAAAASPNGPGPGCIPAPKP